MNTVHYELEEKMGNDQLTSSERGWSPVYQDKVEADYERPDRLTFASKEEARAYAETGGCGKWAPNGLARGYVRIIVVHTIRMLAE